MKKLLLTLLLAAAPAHAGMLVITSGAEKSKAPVTYALNSYHVEQIKKTDQRITLFAAGVTYTYTCPTDDTLHTLFNDLINGMGELAIRRYDRTHDTVRHIHVYNEDGHDTVATDANGTVTDKPYCTVSVRK